MSSNSEQYSLNQLGNIQILGNVVVGRMISFLKVSPKISLTDTITLRDNLGFVIELNSGAIISEVPGYKKRFIFKDQTLLILPFTEDSILILKL